MLDAALLILLAGPADTSGTVAATQTAAPTPAPLVTAHIKQKGTILSRTRRDDESATDQQFVKWDVVVENASDLPGEVTRVRTIVYEQGAKSPWDVVDFGMDEVATLAGTATVAPHGSLQIPLRLYYAGPARPLKISVELKGQLKKDAFFTVTTEALEVQ